MTEIILGPMLRWVGTTAATVWIETDGPCEVQILDQVAKTFHIAGHHYALAVIQGLEPGSSYPYEVRLDGDVRWPMPTADTPPTRIRTLPPDGSLSLAFGSCRVAGPRTAPFGIDRVMRRYDPSLDAMATFSRRLMESADDLAPDMLLLLGDQVYADIAPQASKRFAAQRRDLSEPPGEAMADFEEYTHLYRDSWSEPAIRWLLSTVPSAMIFDDHELVDDWRTSREWIDESREQDGWEDRLAGCLMSYWLYQHLGNMDPERLAENELYLGLCGDEDGYERLRAAVMEDDARPGSRWSFTRDIGGARLIVLDARATRVLGEDGRDMFDELEWQRLQDSLIGARHVLLASSVPVIYAEGFHHIQSWSERVAAGAWGSVAKSMAERLRRALSLSGWPAFGGSFHRLMALLGEVGSGVHGAPPATITILSGDVHHGYVARISWPDPAMQTTVHQLVSSPLRNPLLPHERLAQRVVASRAGTVVTKALAVSARTSQPGVDWVRLEGLDFANQVSTLTLDGDYLRLHSERVVHGSGGHRMQTIWRRSLVDGADRA